MPRIPYLFSLIQEFPFHSLAILRRPLETNLPQEKYVGVPYSHKTQKTQRFKNRLDQYLFVWLYILIPMD